MNEIENGNIKFWKEGGILYSAYKAMSIELDEIKEIIELRHIISNGESQYWVMDIRKLRSASQEVQTYMHEKGQDFIHACAVIVDSFLVKFLVELYMRMYKPRVPMKIFVTKENAVEWLNGIQKENNKRDKCLN